MLKRIGNLLRPVVVLLAVFLVFGLAVVAYQGIRTIQQLTVIEAERDQWQHPAEVVSQLNLKPGSVVVDLGSGAGYFALKLSDRVEPQGQVVAVDLRKLSLLFLRIRAFIRGKHNIQTIIADTDDPHLSNESADAVLIANTYHELSDPYAVLRHTWEALRPDGRLVIVDRAHHDVALDAVEAALRRQNFTIISRQDVFIHPPRDEVWWLIIASKPQVQP